MKLVRLGQYISGGFKKCIDIDWGLFLVALTLTILGLVTMYSYGKTNIYFNHQVVWACITIIIFFISSLIDFRFLRRTNVVVALYVVSVIVLGALFVAGTVVKGAQSWFHIGVLSFQPSDLIKLVVIIILAKYFTRRHIEIARLKHVLVSGFYTVIIFVLVFLQPDFGSAVIIFLLWLGMVFVSGISKKHLAAIFLIGVVTFAGLWLFVFQDYQKQRILNFVHPMANVQGTGYNAYQSMIAVGSGQIVGKGVGFGTQSRLKFLPEFQTDFIFAAFAEEWGFVGVMVLLALYSFLIYRVLVNAFHGASNFETLFGVGVSILFVSHILIQVGTNTGLLPVTGVTIPFMSYGGSHLLTEYLALGILMGMRRYSRPAHKNRLASNEVSGL